MADIFDYFKVATENSDDIIGAIKGRSISIPVTNNQPQQSSSGTVPVATAMPSSPTTKYLLIGGGVLAGVAVLYLILRK